MIQRTPPRQSQLHDALWQRVGQSKVATFEQLCRFAAVEIAAYRHQSEGGDFESQLGFERERLVADSNHQKRATARAIKRLLNAADSTGTPRLLKKSQFVAAVPAVDAAEGCRALWTSESDDGGDREVSAAHRDWELANFAKAAWRTYHHRSLQSPIELFVHPSSCLAPYETKADIRSEPGVTFAHLAELLSRMALADQADVRDAALSFECVERSFRWDDDMPAVTAAEQYAPEAVYRFRGRRVELYFPMAFHWRCTEDIVTFVEQLRRRLRGRPYRICCPGFGGATDSIPPREFIALSQCRAPRRQLQKGGHSMIP